MHPRSWKWKYEFIAWLHGTPKVKWGRNEHWFNKPMISWSICVFPGCIYIPAGFYLPLVYEVLLVYYGIIYTWTGVPTVLVFQLHMCVGTILCFVCCCVLWLHVCSIYENFRTSIWCVQWHVSGISRSLFQVRYQCFTCMFQLDKCTCVPRVNAPTVIKSPLCLHVSVFTY